jgi:MFS family permease
MAWGSSFYLPAILAGPVARDLGVGQSAVFAALSAALLVSGVIGPAIGRHIDRHGGRDVMAASSLVLGLGLALHAGAVDLPTLVVAWVVLGVGMGLGLYDAAFATLGRLYGTTARSAITGITLMAGFASKIAWPLTAYGADAIGWRGTCLAWAAAHVLIALPLNRLVIPAVAVSAPRPTTAPPKRAAPVLDRNMWLLAVAFAAIWFVTGAVAAHLPALLQATGAGPGEALFAAALVGPAQVGARLVEAGVLARWHPLGLLGAPARVAQAIAPLAVSLVLERSATAALLLTGTAAGLTTALALLLVRPSAPGGR